MADDKVEVWGKTLDVAMKLPLVSVDRDSFLRKELGYLCTNQELADVLDGTRKTFEVVSKEKLKEKAASVISYHRNAATRVSALAGIPGGLAMLGTVPLDAVQYFGSLLALSQKLLYLYGAPQITDSNSQLTDSAKDVLTLCIGAAMGEEAARNGLRFAARGLAEQMVKRLPRMALTKYGFYNLVKQVGEWIGVRITKDTFAKGLSKAVPVLGAVTSGGLTYYSYGKMSKRLNQDLVNMMG